MDWRRIREWINRDDGKHYQVGNRSVGALETIGILILIVGVGIVGIPTIKLPNIYGILLMAVGGILSYLGARKTLTEDAQQSAAADAKDGRG